mmetsp:Transcript_58366/g.162699  ORF Transcript_58366/g.162699 Transcript_58366/m.162699 type:complete len:213 (-) Transcript_58366:196-834(-)
MHVKKISATMKKSSKTLTRTSQSMQASRFSALKMRPLYSNSRAITAVLAMMMPPISTSRLPGLLNQPHTVLGRITSSSCSEFSSTLSSSCFASADSHSSQNASKSIATIAPNSVEPPSFALDETKLSSMGGEAASSSLGWSFLATGRIFGGSATSKPLPDAMPISLLPSRRSRRNEATTRSCSIVRHCTNWLTREAATTLKSSCSPDQPVFA